MIQKIYIQTSANILDSLSIVNRCDTLLKELFLKKQEELNSEMQKLYNIQIGSLTRIKENELSNLKFYQKINEDNKSFEISKIQIDVNQQRTETR